MQSKEASTEARQLDFATAIGELLVAAPAAPKEEKGEADRCRWCNQEWTASRTENCRHFSPGAGSCRDCGRQWTGSREAHCAACHRHFSSDSGFIQHQRLDHAPCDMGGEHGPACQAVSVCFDPKRQIKVETPDGPMWRRPGERPPESIPGRTSP
jgi:hypothetical protein